MAYSAIATDQYYTPRNAASLILPYLDDQTIYDAAYGGGNLARYLTDNGKRVVGCTSMDFLQDPITFEYDVIVTNPPYSLKKEFIERAYSLGKPWAMLMNGETVTNVGTSALFRTFGGIQMLIPNKRISYIRNEQQTKVRWDSIWFCWRLLPQDLILCELPPWCD